MALPNNGIITMQDLQNEYGGGNPVNITEYYRNGFYVPSNITIYYNYINGIYTVGQTYWYTDSTANKSGMYLNGTNWRSSGSYSNTQFTSGSRTYTRASYQGAYAQFKYYSYNTYDTTTQAVNQNVPTSGTISLDDFHGGRKT